MEAQFSKHKYRRIFYLHGALFLFPDGYNILKIRRKSNKELIDCIAEEIQNGRMPLFISEGSYVEKRDAINENRYLRYVFGRLKSAKMKIVIYGTSLTPEQDQHIIDAIDSKKRTIAVAIYTKDKSDVELRRQLFDFQSRLAKHRRVIFFDSKTLFNA